MKVVVIASRKGGSGKTTLAGHLAVQAELTGDGPVGLVDTDPQGSLADWWNERREARPHYVQTSVAELPGDLEDLAAQGIRLLIVDTAPALTESVGEVVSLSDLVVIPSRPSPHDLRSIGGTVDIVEHLGKPLIFVLNGAAPRARITGEAVSVLSRHGPLAPTVVHQRVDFAASMIDGRTAMEINAESRAAQEVGELWDYLRCRLTGVLYRPRLPGLEPRVATRGGLALVGSK
jgi:chromosome partitioning protein